MFLTEQNTCRNLDEEIITKTNKINDLERLKKEKEKELSVLEKKRDYLVKEETDEFPEVLVCIIQKRTFYFMLGLNTTI